MIWWILFWIYVVPMVFLILETKFFELENPFNKFNRWRVLTPFVNLYFTFVTIFVLVTMILIEFGDFCADVVKAFKKNFLT